MLEVLLSHREHIARVCQEDIATFLVFGHILIFALLEVLQFCIVVTLYPACLVEMNGLPAALGIVFVLESVLDNLELQLTYRSDNLAAIKLVDKQLGDALVHQLVDTFLQLLRLHGVIVLDVFEEFWRERWQTTEMQLLALGQCVANLEDAIVGQTNDIAGPSLIDGALALSHKLSRTGKT